VGEPTPASSPDAGEDGQRRSEDHRAPDAGEDGQRSGEDRRDRQAGRPPRLQVMRLEPAPPLFTTVGKGAAPSGL
jgi:hypothetical protein